MSDEPQAADELPIPDLAELEDLVNQLRADLSQERAENTKANILADADVKLPAAYRALVVASEDEETVRESLKAVTEQFKADFAKARPPVVGAPTAAPGSAAPPRWHGRRPSEISPQDWPEYKRTVLGIR